MRRLLVGLGLVGLLAGCADILGLDPLGPVVHGEDDGAVDAGAEASTPADASDQ